MLVEPQIPRETLLHLLANHYQVNRPNLEFIPKGECSWNYQVSANGKNYFLKIHTDFALPLERFELLARIYEKAHIEEILHPIKTVSGEAYVWLDDYPVVLFPYVDGENGFEKPFPEVSRFKIGEAIAKLHQAKEIIGDYSVKEDFIFPYTEQLEKLLEIKQWENNYQMQTIKLLHKNKPKILQALEKLVKKGQETRKKSPELVICHGDIHDGNILLDRDGRIHIIDWDDVKMAPREKDLSYINAFSETTRGYKSIFPDIEIDQEIIDFYKLRWNLSEIYDWSNRILIEQHEQIEYQRFLEGLEEEVRNAVI